MIDNSPSIALVALGVVLIAVGVYLILERSLSRIVLGFTALANGVNVMLLVAGGSAGEAPLVGLAEPDDMADPLAQAMILTAIVISLSTAAFMLAIAYRSWQLNGNDETQDDLEDKRLARRAQRDELIDRDDNTGTLDDDLAESRDETAESEPELEPETDRQEGRP